MSTRKDKKELSEFMRGRIVEAAANGSTATQIARRLDVPRTTVQYTLKKNFVRGRPSQDRCSPELNYYEGDQEESLHNVRAIALEHCNYRPQGDSPALLGEERLREVARTETAAAHA